jgi:hypothetical protein
MMMEKRAPISVLREDYGLSIVTETRANAKNYVVMNFSKSTFWASCQASAVPMGSQKLAWTT